MDVRTPFHLGRSLTPEVYVLEEEEWLRQKAVACKLEEVENFLLRSMYTSLNTKRRHKQTGGGVPDTP